MKHILILLLSVITVSAQHVAINVGVTNNDGTGDSIRSAFAKVNTNFANIYTNASGAFTNRTLTGSTVATNLNGIAIFSTNWTAGTGTATYRTNTIFTVPLAAAHGALINVDLALIDTDTLSTVAARQSVFGYEDSGAIFRSATTTNLTLNAINGGMFFTSSGASLVVKAWAGDTSTWTGRASIQILNTP